MKVFYMRLLAAFIFVAPSSFAEVLIDLDSQSEIGISNTQTLSHYTDKIEEPVFIEPSTKSVLKKINSNKINNLPYHNEVVAAAQATSIEPALLHAIIRVESKHNATAISKKGAFGLMQLMPETAARFNVSNKKDPQQNILAGAKYMQELLAKYNGDLNLSLAAYNAGPGAVQKYGGKIPPYSETLNYVPQVLKYYRQYS